MQRKNSILRCKSNQFKARSGMAMIMAIVVLVILATLMALSLNLTTQTSKRTTDMYLYEQAVLLSKSAAEYGMLRISQEDPCTLDKLDFTYENMYDVNITMKYVAFQHPGAPGNNCFDNTVTGVTAPRYGITTTEKSDGTVIMDITISTQANVATEPIRYFKRFLDKM